MNSALSSGWKWDCSHSLFHRNARRVEVELDVCVRCDWWTFDYYITCTVTHLLTTQVSSFKAQVYTSYIESHEVWLDSQVFLETHQMSISSTHSTIDLQVAAHNLIGIYIRGLHLIHHIELRTNFTRTISLKLWNNTDRCVVCLHCCDVHCCP